MTNEAPSGGTGALAAVWFPGVRIAAVLTVLTAAAWVTIAVFTIRALFVWATTDRWDAAPAAVVAVVAWVIINAVRTWWMARARGVAVTGN